MSSSMRIMDSTDCFVSVWFWQTILFLLCSLNKNAQFYVGSEENAINLLFIFFQVADYKNQRR